MMRALLALILLVLPLAAQEDLGLAVFNRPVPADGGPTEIRCVIAVLDVDEISDANQNFTVNVYVAAEWNDPRQAHEGPGRIRKKVSEVWHPHLIFFNRQRSWSTLKGVVEIEPDGDVTYREQFWGDFSQPMNLKDFPFDTQDFELRFVATGPEKFGELKIIPAPNSKSFYFETYSVADWKLIGSRIDTSPLELPTGGKTESFAFIFTAERLTQHYLIKIIAPLLMIVILSWVVFWLDPKEGGSQLGVAVTAFLTMIAYHVALGSKLPEISYLTRLDIFVFGSTLLVFFAMMEVVVTTGLARTERVALARWLDRVCRLLFPGVLALVGYLAFFAN